MNKLMYVGVITSFHGVKGEVKILSKLKNKTEIFNLKNALIIDDKEYIIKSYRRHKNLEMVSFNDLNNLNDVEFLRGKKVYYNIEETKDTTSKYRIIGYTVISDSKPIGSIKDIVNYGSCDILEVIKDDAIFNIAYIENAILNIDDTNKQVEVLKEMIM